MNEQDLNTVENMEKYGGSFVKAIAVLARHADPINLQKIKNTWSKYWKNYEECNNNQTWRQVRVSSCCSAPIINQDLCGKCREHC